MSAWLLLLARHCSCTSLLVFPCRPWAKTETTKTLMRKEMKRAMDDSMKKYLLASRTAGLCRRSISRDLTCSEKDEMWTYSFLRKHSHLLIYQTFMMFRYYTNNNKNLTSAECRYKLWGMITAPMIPTAWSTSRLPQFEHHGTIIPLTTSP